MRISQVLSHGNYISINRTLISKLGLVSACMLSELMDEYEYYFDRNMLIDDGWFFSTRENIEKKIGLSRKQQDSAIKKLIDLGLIEKKRKGVPPKKHFKLNENKIWFFLSRDDVEPTYDEVLDGQIELSKRDKLNCPKGTNSIVQKGQYINEPNNEPKETIKNNNNMDVFEFVEHAYGRPITGLEFEKIQHMVNENNIELVKFGFENAITRGKRYIGYVETCLRDWQSQGITTPNQAQGYIENFSNEKPKRQYKPNEISFSSFLGEKKLKEFEELNKVDDDEIKY